MSIKKVVVLSGAGVSAESGIKTFRDSGGLWEEHRIEDVASPEGWRRNRELVLNFYNQRRRQLLTCQPNRAHYALAELEQQYEVVIITQNVDDLHERAGSTRVLHLHGELLKARSSVDDRLVYDWSGDINLGDKCEKGSQLRPHIVWFGEMVPKIEEAVPLVQTADILIVVGTSLVVYPAAGLVNFSRYEIPKYLIDPNPANATGIPNLQVIQQPASTGVDQLVKNLLHQTM
ncbi:MAG: NAD-dependent deacylase [Chitinophagales bacterium]